MSANPQVRVHPHPVGEWLVIVGQRRLAVPPQVGRRLLTLDGRRPSAAELGVRLGCGEEAAAGLAGPACRARRGPRLTLTLLSGRLVGRWASRLAPGVSPRFLAVMVVAGVAGLLYGSSATGGSANATDWAVGVVMFIMTALLHEMAHAAALRRAGYPPGDIGVGLMFLLPVLWCDVSAVALLSPRRRVVVDLAGPALQLGCAGVLALMAWLPVCGGAARVASRTAVLAVIWSLLPFLRTDGFWLLSDLAGIGPLDRKAVTGDGVRERRLLAVHRLMHGGFLWAIAAVSWQRGRHGDGWPALVAMVAAVALLAAGAVRLGPLLPAGLRRLRS